MVDESAMTGVKTLATAILALTAADLISGIASFSPFSSSFAELGTELSTFMANVLPFVAGASTITPQVAESVKSIAAMILALTAADVLQGLTSWITGGSSLADFGAELSGLGEGLNSFITNLGTFGESELSTITYASNAIKVMAEAANALPNEGGWAAKIFGDNSIATFASNLPGLATNLNSFATNLGTFDEAKLNTITYAAEAIKAIAVAANEIPNEGGWAAKIFGDNSIATFGSKLPDLGTNLAAFATNLGTFNDDTVKTVKCAANAIKVMAQAADGIDGQAEWAKKLFGDNSIATFSGDLPTLGTNLNSFVTNLGTFNQEQVTTVNSAVKAIKAFSILADADLKNATKHLPDFGDDITELATDITTFCTDLPTSDSITTALTNINKIIEMIKAVNTDTTGVESFVESLQSIGEKGVTAFVTAFTSEEAQTDVQTAGEKLIQKVVDGAESKEKTLTDSVSSLVTAAKDDIKSEDNYDSFYGAGDYLVTGFADGISENTWYAAAKSRAMAAAAAEAAEDELDIHSPSRVGYGIGNFFGIGFLNALGDNVKKAYNASAGVAKSAVSGMSDAISKTRDMVDLGIDSQPTIRPVLDLSDVESGAGMIGSMFGINPSVGVLSNIKTIGTMMNRRNQNGTNDDVVSAIKDLDRTMRDKTGDTYAIGDISYSEGSEVSDAIRALTGAIIRERRM